MKHAFSAWAFCLTLSLLDLQAQDKHSQIDVQKYTIDAEINPRTQSISATAKVAFTPLDAVNDATFELNNALTVSKVVDKSNQPLQTSRGSNDYSLVVH